MRYSRLCLAAVLVATSTQLYAATVQITQNDRAKMLQQQQSGGEDPISDSADTRKSDVERGGTDSYYEAILAEYYLEHNRQKSKINGFGEKMLLVKDNMAVYDEQLKERVEDEERMLEEQRLIESQDNSFYTRGYCSFLNTVDVSEMVAFAEIECMLDNIGKTILSINIYPEHSAKALVGRPIAVIPYTAPAQQNQKRLIVKEGVLLNAQRTGINIASIVNDRKVERMVAAGMLATNNIATTESLRYMDALNQSKQSQNSEVVPGTGGSAPIVIQSSTTQPPDTADYMAIAGIKMVSSLIGIIGESMVNDLPYLYRINRGQRVYFDGLVSSQIPQPNYGPIDYTNNSVVNKTRNNVSVDKNGIVTFQKSKERSKTQGDNLKIKPIQGEGENPQNIKRFPKQRSGSTIHYDTKRAYRPVTSKKD